MLTLITVTTFIFPINPFIMFVLSFTCVHRSRSPLLQINILPLILMTCSDGDWFLFPVSIQVLRVILKIIWENGFYLHFNFWGGDYFSVLIWNQNCGSGG